jgi:alpha-galactosidase
MVMWHYDDTVESAAMQLIHALFTVPQISVRLDEVPESHVDMIRRYLAFWREHRDVLLDGEIRPLQPQHAYPAVVARRTPRSPAARSPTASCRCQRWVIASCCWPTAPWMSAW